MVSTLEAVEHIPIKDAVAGLVVLDRWSRLKKNIFVNRFDFDVAGLVVLDRWSRLIDGLLSGLTSMSLALLYWIDGLDLGFGDYPHPSNPCRWPCCIG